MVGRRLRNATEKLVDTFKWQERVQQMNISKHLSLRAINEHLLSMRTHTQRETHTSISYSDWSVYLFVSCLSGSNVCTTTIFDCFVERFVFNSLNIPVVHRFGYECFSRCQINILMTNRIERKSERKGVWEISYFKLWIKLNFTSNASRNIHN